MKELQKSEGERAKANKDLENLTDKKQKREKDLEEINLGLKDHNILMKKFE